MISLPTTKKYAWKYKNICLSNLDSLPNFLNEKKDLLFKNLTAPDLYEDNLLRFLPDPWSLKDVEKAAKRIIQAIEEKQSIAIFGDYDVDGTTSCAMLSFFFHALGVHTQIYIPDRLTEGYGLNSVGVRNLAQQGIQLIITVDNGISATQACDLAKQLSIDVIITDHHDLPDILPDAFAIINPKQKDCLFPYKMLAGVGVAFYLIIAIRALLREKKYSATLPNLKDFLDYVCIGTIADMAPLDGINHILCREGLGVLSKLLLSGKRPGLFYLLKNAGWNGYSPINAYDIGFKIGPRLNAAGRLGNALKTVELLMAKDEAQAQELATILHDENTSRQQLEKHMTSEALNQVQSMGVDLPDAFVLHKEDWHVGVVGLVASRILEKFYRPTLVFCTVDGKLKGSGRSIHSFNLFEALDKVRHEFISFGGHFHAVGLTICPSKLDWLKQYLKTQAEQSILPSDKVPPLAVDGHLKLQDFDMDFLEKMDRFEPYGIGNSRSKWLVGPVQIKHIKPIGKDPQANHAKILVIENEKEFWLTAFGMAQELDLLFQSGLDIHVVLDIKRNVWNQREYLDFSIVDFAPVVYV